MADMNQAALDKIASPVIQDYFNRINTEVKKCYDIATTARHKGLDPEEEVSIPLAKNMAERVVGLISVIAPQIINTGIPERIIELEKQYGLLDWRVGFTIAEEVAKEKFCKFTSKQEAMEIGIRVGFAYLTLGIVSAPLEGFIGLKIKKRNDGQEYFALQYAGPIRAAGGTAGATSVVLCDYIRVKMGYATYDPNETEVNRYVMEVQDYHERVTNLQYFPSEEELRFMVSHIPVEVDGDPTEKIEVSNYKDLPRIETNLIRGGVALVLAEGLSQKSAKLWKRLSKWGKQLGLEWDWLGEFIKLKEKIHAAHASKSTEKTGEAKDAALVVKETKKTPKPNNTYLMDLVAGRPILTHPLAAGGFRLRYGRTRATGFSATAIHPATMIVLDKFIAIGTQIKIERPGKAGTITVCDTLDGPIVKLKDGSVLYLRTEADAKKCNSEVEEIIFLGDILFNYGDFSENGQDLVPAGYCPEWWALEAEKAISINFTEGGVEKAALEIGLSKEKLSELIEKPLLIVPTIEEAVSISSVLKVSLHPEYIYYWKLVSGSDIQLLLEYLKEGKLKVENKEIKKLVLPYYPATSEVHLKAKRVLELVGIPHQVVNKDSIVIGENESKSIALCFNFKSPAELELLNISAEQIADKNGLDALNLISPVSLRDKAGTFIGARMGRPEKAKMREMTGSPQVMFPVGGEGDRLRSFQSAMEAGKVTSTFPLFYCEACQKEMVYPHCEECAGKCVKRYHCRVCGVVPKETCRHGPTYAHRNMEVDIKYYFNKAKDRLKETIHPDLIKGVRGTSNKEHLVEHLAKGILRAKHNIYVNKEGTTRYDCTELPLTGFKPKEIKTSIEKLRKLGYNTDIYGNELEHDDQVLELRPQDIILPGFDSLDESAPKVLSRVANFLDELLIKFYGLKPFYKVKKEEDLVGHLVIGLAPHISAATVGRIVGFSETQGLITHPMFHAGMRRDCVHPNTRFVYEDDKEEIKYNKIGSFVETLIKNGAKTKKIDGFGTLKVECDQEYFVFGVDPKNYKLKKKNVKYFIKAPIPKKWVKITTSTKRSLMMTETHDFMYFLENQLHIKKAHLAKNGDKILLLNLKKTRSDKLKHNIYKLTYEKELFNQKYSLLGGINDVLIDEVVKVESFKEKVNSYCLNIEYDSDQDKNILWENQILNTRCDGDEACVMLLMDALLNFSRKFLPNTRGGVMDAPLVLTSILYPSEVDDQVHGLDVAWKYPLELYEAALEMKKPWEVKFGPEQKKMPQLGDRLNTPAQYEGFGFTHPIDNFNKGVQCSAYKILPSMNEKLIGQMEIARKVRAVNLDDVARLVIQKHFLKDIKGNLKKFSMQQFRCVKCNTSYRRPPLCGKCTTCGGKIIFTITEGSVIKYLGPSLLLCQKYDFSPYLKQTIELLKFNADCVFGKEKDKQVGLGAFV
jgi:DNA polymerase II large subunit